MSPSKRKRPTGKGRGEQATAGGPSAVQRRRLGLLIFGVLFLVLFVVIAVADGIGDPNVPSGDVALVQDAPGDTGKITQAKFDHALLVAAATDGAKKAPKPGDPKYDELKKSTMESILEGVWIQGLADEMGIEATDKEIADELKKVETQTFKSPAEFKKFLKKSHYTPADVNERVKLQVLSTKLQEQLREDVPKPSKSEVENYYEAAKATQFTTKPSREVRLITNKDRKKAEQALAALRKDDSPKSWKKVAKKYSEDPSAATSGGLQKELQEGLLEEPLNELVFGASEGQLEGPVKTKTGYNVFAVEGSTPESVQELKAVESQIQSTLSGQLEQEFFATFVADFSAKWKLRTFCASGYEIDRCDNFKAESHSATADPACYEANPKGGLPEACPAPVFQLVPALPGTVTPLEPKGKPLPQRPRPAGEEKEASVPTELPPGAIPTPTE